MLETSKEEQGSKFSTLPEDLKTFVEKVKGDIFHMIEIITPGDIQEYSSQLTPEDLAFFNSHDFDKDKDLIEAKTRYIATHSVLDQLTPKEIDFFMQGVGYLPGLHDLKNVIHRYSTIAWLKEKRKQNR